MAPRDLDHLPDDPDRLRELVRTLAAERDLEKERADRLEHLNAQFRHLLFGRKSERLPPDDRQLGFEDLEQSVADVQAGAAPESGADEDDPAAGQRRPPGQGRASLPGHLPEEARVIDIPAAEKVCPCCGGVRHVIGEDVSRRLDVVPARFRILVTRRPRYGCRVCETGVAQAAAPEQVVAGGLPTDATIAHVLIAKYADSLPLYRQAAILARQGIAVDRSVLAGWVGAACWWLRPLYERLRRHLMASAKLFADETRLPVLDPGRGQTKTGQLWSYVRDDRPWAGPDPPAVAYVYADGRGHEQARMHLAGFAGVLRVDGYAAYKSLVKTARGAPPPLPVTLAFCWAHLRRRFHDLQRTQAAPVAAEALHWIAALYRIEADIRGRPAAARLAARQAHSRPLVAEMKAWLEAQAARVSRKAPLGEAVRYALNPWDGLCLFLDDGRIEMDPNAVERSIRPQALTRKNALFAGSAGGAQHWAMGASLIETAKLNGVEPYAYLKGIFETLVNDFPQSRLDELMPWNWTARSDQPTAVNA